jgi:hypothetical protein
VREGTHGSALAGAIDPIYDYSHGSGPLQGNSVTGGYVYRGPIAALHGHYFFADFVRAQVWSMKWNGDPPNAHDGTNFTDFNDWTPLITTNTGSIAAISSFGEDAAGNLYVIDLNGGEIFRIDSAIIPTLAGASKMLDGVKTGGEIADLNTRDDIYLEIDPSPTANPRKQKIELLLQAIANKADPEQLEFRVQAHMTGGPPGDVIQKVRLLNWQTRQFVELDSRPATNTDSVAVATATGDLSDFVHPTTREITASLQWQSPEFSGAPFTWSVSVDEAVWTVTD